jgi:hypothetical protein
MIQNENRVDGGTHKNMLKKLLKMPLKFHANAKTEVL